MSALSAYDSLANWLTTKFGKAANKIILPYQETADGSLVLPPPTPVIVVGGTLAAGTLSTLVGTDNKLATTETSAAGIANNAYNIYITEAYANSPPTVAAATSLSANDKRRVAVVPLTEAAGAITATEIIAALAGYYAVLDKLWIWSPQTDAASTWTIASGAGGGITGIASVSIEVGANKTTELIAGVPNVGGASCPLICYNTTDNKSITLAAAGLPNVGTTYYAVLQYHYET